MRKLQLIAEVGTLLTAPAWNATEIGTQVYITSLYSES